MSLNLIIRRTHIYLGMFLFPWFLMYGISALPFSHNQFFQKQYDDGVPQWTVRFDRNIDVEIPAGEDIRNTAARILEKSGLNGAYGASRPNPRQVNVYLFDFWSATRLTYFVEESRLLAEDRRFRWDHFLTGMHARGGFDQDSFLNDAWAVLVDIICLALVLWIATGLYMWWMLRQTRFWGAVTLFGGIASFLVFMLAL